MQSEPTRSAAYDDGFHAYAKKKPRECPYIYAAAIRRQQWLEGFDDAKQADAWQPKPRSERKRKHL